MRCRYLILLIILFNSFFIYNFVFIKYRLFLSFCGTQSWEDLVVVVMMRMMKMMMMMIMVMMMMMIMNIIN